MQAQPTNLRELFLHAPTWFRVTNACRYTLGSIFFNSARDSFVWQWPLPQALHKSVRTDANPHSNITINTLKIVAHVTPHMSLLEYTLDSIDSTAAHGWNVCNSIRDNVITVLLAWKVLQTCASINIYSMAYVPGPLNRLADDTSCLLHASPHALLAFFNAQYPQKNCGNTLP